MKLTPFLLFEGNCAEAMTFYQSCLGGDLTISRIGDTPMKGQMSPQMHQKVAHAHLKSGLIEFSATDWMHATRQPRQGNTVAMYLNGGQYKDLRTVFDRLAMGAAPNCSTICGICLLGATGILLTSSASTGFSRGRKKSRG